MTDSENIQRRLARIESRLVQLMIHMGSDPYERTYDNLSGAKYANPSRSNPQSNSKTKGGNERGIGQRSRIRDFFTRSSF